MKKIFVSHQTKDKNIADILVDFLIAIGIQADTIFCSSIPGNDVKEKISDAVVPLDVTVYVPSPLSVKL